MSSSEGSVESCRIQLGFVQSLYLLRLLCRPLVAWRLNAVCEARGLCVSSGGGTWVLQIKGGVGSPAGETPSSSVVCRLPTELPVAREELLWYVCSKKQQKSHWKEKQTSIGLSR